MKFYCQSWNRPAFDKIQKREGSDGKPPREQRLISGQPYEIFTSLFYFLDNSTLVHVVECGTYG